MPNPMRSCVTLLSFFAALLLFTACGSDAPEAENPTDSAEEVNQDPIPEGTTIEQVQFLVDNNRFEEALEILRAEEGSDPQMQAALRDTHFLYGEWLMYHAETVEMNVRMPRALEHFRRVLELEPENEAAQANIEQIEGVYRSMGRPVPEGVAD